MKCLEMKLLVPLGMMTLACCFIRWKYKFCDRTLKKADVFLYCIILELSRWCLLIWISIMPRLNMGRKVSFCDRGTHQTVTSTISTRTFFFREQWVYRISFQELRCISFLCWNARQTGAGDKHRALHHSTTNKCTVSPLFGRALRRQ